ncbi:MAG: hypothetical protein AAGA38_05020 [Pseudomonadota bacterium]
MTTSILLAPPALAQDSGFPRTDAQFMADVLGLDDGVSEFEEILPKYLDLFRQNDLDGEPGYSLKDRQMYVDAWEAEQFSKQIQEFLSHDLNGDLTVTPEELRVAFTRSAYRGTPLQRPNPAPGPDRIEAHIAEKTAAYLRTRDLDGDTAVSFDEANVKAREIARHARATTVPVPRMAPSLAHDLDNNTVISEREMVALARQLHAAFDGNGNGIIDPDERTAAHRMRKAPPPFMFGRARTAAREIEGPTCPWPRGDESLNYYVIGGFEGAALSNLHFENRNEAVEVVAITVPEEGSDIRLIASFQNATILDIEDPSRRVKVVYQTRGPIGLLGARSARLVRTDPSCHLELWKPVSAENPDPISFYRTALRRAPAGVVTDYSLGLVDLGAQENAPRRRFPTSIDIDLSGPNAEYWVHFLRFNPGGLVRLNPRFVTYPGEVGAHPVLPQYAGLATLVEEGVLEPLPRDGRIDGVGGTRRSVTINGTTYRTGAGDDAIRNNGLIYRYEREGLWTGRAPVSFRVTDGFTVPAGLTGAHAVTFVLPDDVPEPRGARGHSTLERESPNTTFEE